MRPQILCAVLFLGCATTARLRRVEKAAAETQKEVIDQRWDLENIRIEQGRQKAIMRGFTEFREAGCIELRTKLRGLEISLADLDTNPNAVPFLESLHKQTRDALTDCIWNRYTCGKEDCK